MKIDIHLNKFNRRTLRKLCIRLFVNFDYVKVNKKTVIFKRKWYSLKKTRMQVVDLVLLSIPQAINDLYEEYEFNPPFTYAKDLHSAVEYFGIKTMGKGDFIQFLQYQIDNVDMSINLNENYDATPITLQEQEEVIMEESYATNKIFHDTLTYFYNIITDVISKIQPRLRIVHRSTESACNSPPIRGPSIALSA